MEILVRGNKESFQLRQKIEHVDIILSGNFAFIGDNPVFLDYQDHRLSFKNRQQFYHFAEETKGASVDKLILLLQEFKLPNLFSDGLKRKGEIEVNLFKSVFLIYTWIEIAITDAYAVSLSDKIYDEFIIDYSSKPEVQKDIYFVHSKYLNAEYLPQIQRLIDLNLLASASFKTVVGNFQSYFIPLIKPGVSREYFNSAFDENGSKTYSLWKEILSERDIRIRYWINHRNT